MKVKVKSLSRVRLFAAPWTVAYQAPPSVEFSRQEYWSGLPFPSPILSNEDDLNQEIYTNNSKKEEEMFRWCSTEEGRVRFEKGR